MPIDPLSAHIAAAGLLLGLLLGVVVTLIMICWPPAPRSHTRRQIKTTARQPHVSAERATLQAVMMVESGAFSGPKRS